jgi:hypothetical protein
MHGTRLHDGEFTRRLSGSDPRELSGGEYGRVRRDGGWVWMCNTPNGHHGDLSAHTVTENEDGTITVEPSILVSVGIEQRWHGYLRAGVWTEC